jgi:hypothetical protein
MHCPNRDCAGLPVSGVPKEVLGLTSVCPACGTALVATVSSPPGPHGHDRELVPCMTVANIAMLPHIRGLLDTSGIEYFVQNEEVQNMMAWGSVGLGYSQAFGPAIVMVGSDQLDYARDVLRPLMEPTPPTHGAVTFETGVVASRAMCSHCHNEIESESGDEPLTNCYHCGWPLGSA